MLDWAYYIIKVGLRTARFMDKGNAKTSETGTSVKVQAPLFLYPQPAGDAGISSVVIIAKK